MKKRREAGGDELSRKKPVRKERPKAKPKIETTAAQPVLSERDRKRHRQVWIQRIVIALVLCTILVGGVICLKIFLTPKTVNVSVPYTESAETEAAQAKVPMPDIDLQLLTVNEYSWPGLSTGTINGVVVHYTANPGSTAQQNRDYFENLKDTHTTKVSSNSVIGLEERSSSASPRARSPTPPTAGTQTRSPSSAVIRMRPESLRTPPMIRWCS